MSDLDKFTCTREELLSLTQKGRHRMIAQWLKDKYISHLNKSSAISKTDVISRYKQLLDWIGLDTTCDTDDFQRFILDRFHFHWGHTGQNLREHDYPGFTVLDTFQKEYHPSVNASVLLDNVRSAYNVGSIFRTVDAFGWKGIIRYGYTAGSDSPAVKKVALGAEKWIPDEKIETVESLTKRNISLIALDTYTDSPSIFDYNWIEPFILIMGNEEYGICRELSAAADVRLKIPMLGNKNSLNLSNCFASAAIIINQKLGKYA